MNTKIMITRHQALVAYAREIGLIDEDTPVLAHATVENVEGKHVIGVLPLSLAAHAASVTEIPLALTPEDRGKELPIERVRELAGEPVMMRVRIMTEADRFRWIWAGYRHDCKVVADVIEHRDGQVTVNLAIGATFTLDAFGHQRVASAACKRQVTIGWSHESPDDKVVATAEDAVDYVVAAISDAGFGRSELAAASIAKAWREMELEK